MQDENEVKKYMECVGEYWYQTARQDGCTFLTKVPADPLYQVHDKTLKCALEETFFYTEKGNQKRKTGFNYFVRKT